MKNLELEKCGLIEIENEEQLSLNGGGNLFNAAKELFFGVLSAMQDLGTGAVKGYHDGRIYRIIDESQKIA